jgi:hypothetical protein
MLLHPALLQHDAGTMQDYIRKTIRGTQKMLGMSSVHKGIGPGIDVEAVLH